MSGVAAWVERQVGAVRELVCIVPAVVVVGEGGGLVFAGSGRPHHLNLLKRAVKDLAGLGRSYRIPTVEEYRFERGARLIEVPRSVVEELVEEERARIREQERRARAMWNRVETAYLEEVERRRSGFPLVRGGRVVVPPPGPVKGPKGARSRARRRNRR